MGLRGEAAIVGVADWKPERKFSGTPAPMLEQWAELARLALEDAGIAADEVDGLVTPMISESIGFAPATVRCRRAAPRMALLESAMLRVMVVVFVTLVEGTEHFIKSGGICICRERT